MSDDLPKKKLTAKLRKSELELIPDKYPIRFNTEFYEDYEPKLKKQHKNKINMNLHTKSLFRLQKNH
jgi:hypothetical protein